MKITKLGFLMLFFSISGFSGNEPLAERLYTAWQKHFLQCLKEHNCPLDCMRLSKERIDDWLPGDAHNPDREVLKTKVNSIIDEMKRKNASEAFQVWEKALSNDQQTRL